MTFSHQFRASLVVISLFLFLDVGYGLSLDISMDPSGQLNELSDRLDISCSASANDSSFDSIVLIEMFNDNDETLALISLGSAEPSYGTVNHTNFTVFGDLDQDGQWGNLVITLLEPNKKDAGVYKCIAYSLNHLQKMQETSTSRNVTWVKLEVSDLESFMKNLLHKVSELESNIKNIPKKGTDLGSGVRERLNSLKDKVEDHSKLLRYLDREAKDALNSLLETENRLRNKTKDIITNIKTENLKGKIHNLHGIEIWLEEHIQNETKDYNRLEDKLSSLEGIEAFSATNEKVLEFWLAFPLVFSQVITKRGQGYNETTGIFTAPSDGLYAFYLTLTTFRRDYSVDVDLIAAGQRVASLRVEHDVYDDQNSISAVVSLKKNDQVKAVPRGWRGWSALPQGELNLFSGYKIS